MSLSLSIHIGAPNHTSAAPSFAHIRQSKCYLTELLWIRAKDKRVWDSLSFQVSVVGECCNRALTTLLARRRNTNEEKTLEVGVRSSAVREQPFVPELQLSLTPFLFIFQLKKK